MTKKTYSLPHLAYIAKFLYASKNANEELKNAESYKNIWG